MPPKQNGQKLKNLKPKRSQEMAAVDEQYERDLKQLERLRVTNNNVEQIIQALEYKHQHLMECAGYFQYDFEFETGIRGVAMLMHVAKEAIEVQARQERQAEQRKRRQAQERAQIRIEGAAKVSHNQKNEVQIQHGLNPHLKIQRQFSIQINGQNRTLPRINNYFQLMKFLANNITNSRLVDQILQRFNGQENLQRSRRIMRGELPNTTLTEEERILIRLHIDGIIQECVPPEIAFEKQNLAKQNELQTQQSQDENDQNYNISDAVEKVEKVAGEKTMNTKRRKSKKPKLTKQIHISTVIQDEEIKEVPRDPSKSKRENNKKK